MPDRRRRRIGPTVSLAGDAVRLARIAMRGLGLRDGLATAAKADLASIAAWQVGMAGVKEAMA